MNRMIAILMSGLLMWGGVATQVAASMIETRDVLAVETRAVRVADIQAQLAREDVQLAMQELGVDPLEAQLRVDSLSDQELVALQGQLDTLPAGGNGLLALLGVVFVVLLVLELVGVTNVFTRA